MKQISVQDLEGFTLGHATNTLAGTGCTVIICEEGGVAGVDVRGGAPGTRETDLLRSENMVDRVHAIFLSGGSAYGLDVGSGVMEALEQRNIGFDSQVAKIPIVPGAILFDLSVGDPTVRPDREMGKDATLAAFGRASFTSGNVGAGTGATVGKLKGTSHAMKGGIGSACFQLGDLKVGAVVAVNAFGDIVDSSTGKLVAGVQEQGVLLNTEQLLMSPHSDLNDHHPTDHTTIGVVLTNGLMTKPQANKLASVAHTGLARTIRPCHTDLDGDTMFAISTGTTQANMTVVSVLTTLAVEKAILDAVQSALPAYGLLAAQVMER